MMNFISFQVKKFFNLGKLRSILTLSFFILLFHASLCNFWNRSDSYFYNSILKEEAKNSLSSQEIQHYEKLYYRLKEKYKELKSETLKSEIEEQFPVELDFFNWMKLLQEIFEPRKNCLAPEGTQVDLHPKLRFVKTKIEEWDKLHKQAESLKAVTYWDSDIYDLVNKAIDFGRMYEEASFLWNFYQNTDRFIKKLGIYFTYECELLKAGSSIEVYSLVSLKIKNEEILDKIQINQAQKEIEKFLNFIKEVSVLIAFPKFFPLGNGSRVLFRIKEKVELMFDELRFWAQSNKNKNFYDFLKSYYSSSFSGFSQSKTDMGDVSQALNELEKIINKVIGIKKDSYVKQVLTILRSQKNLVNLGAFRRAVGLKLHPDKKVRILDDNKGIVQLSKQDEEAIAEIYSQINGWITAKEEDNKKKKQGASSDY